MWTHLPSVEEEHREAELQNNHVIPLTHNGPHRLKLLSGLTVVQRDYLIGAHTVTQSTAHIKGSRTGVSSIPRDSVEERGGDTEDEIDRFTSAPETSAQPSSSTPA